MNAPRPMARTLIRVVPRACRLGEGRLTASIPRNTTHTIGALGGVAGPEPDRSVSVS